MAVAVVAYYSEQSCQLVEPAEDELVVVGAAERLVGTPGLAIVFVAATVAVVADTESAAVVAGWDAFV